MIYLLYERDYLDAVAAAITISIANSQSAVNARRCGMLAVRIIALKVARPILAGK